MGWGRDRDISLQGFSGHAFISLLRISLLRIHYGQVQFLLVILSRGCHIACGNRLKTNGFSCFLAHRPPRYKIEA